MRAIKCCACDISREELECAIECNEIFITIHVKESTRKWNEWRKILISLAQRFQLNLDTQATDGDVSAGWEWANSNNFVSVNTSDVLEQALWTQIDQRNENETFECRTVKRRRVNKVRKVKLSTRSIFAFCVSTEQPQWELKWKITEKKNRLINVRIGRWGWRIEIQHQLDRLKFHRQCQEKKAPNKIMTNLCKFCDNQTNDSISSDHDGQRASAVVWELFVNELLSQRMLNREEDKHFH